MNPIALLMMALGLALMALGVIWAFRRSRSIGIGTALVGFLLVILPWAVSLSLAR